MTHRLNARIDDELAEKLELLKRRTRKSVTEIVRAAIELYYQRTTGGSEEALRILEGAGFIGCGEDDPDLSARYKERLTESLSKKSG